MNIRAALVALVVLALVPEAFAAAQPAQQTQQSTRTTITTTNGPSSRNAQHDWRFRRHRHNRPWWTPTVIIDSSMVQQMLNSPTPRPPSGKNTIDKPGGEVFKSIGN